MVEKKLNKNQLESIHKILHSLSDEERVALRNWFEELLEIRDSIAGRRDKLKRLRQSIKGSKSLWPIIRSIANHFKGIGWDNRGKSWRFFWGGAAFGVLLFGFQGAGLAALGSAIGFPLWVVFGAGGLVAKAIIDEINRSN